VGKRTANIYVCHEFFYGAWQWDVFSVRLELAHDKDDEQTNGVNGRWKKMFVVRHKQNARQTNGLLCANIKTHGKLFFDPAFFCRAP
jgi:hypothetical protein